MLNLGLEGKVVIVSGANNPQGIGAAIAKAFALQGASVFITYMQLPVPDDVDFTNVDEPGMAMYSYAHRMPTKSSMRFVMLVGLQMHGKPI